jgi:thiol-disulfide isomerase/thioredoxin
MPRLRWIAILLALTLIPFSLASDTGADRLKIVIDYQTGLLKEAQEKAKDDGKFDMGAVQNQVRAKAIELTKDIDASKVDPAQSMDWAMLFSIAAKHKESQALLSMYIATKPDGMKLYRAQSMLLDESNLNQDPKTTAETLLAMKPYDLASSLGYASLVCTYAPEVATVKSVDEAISLIDKALSNVNQAQLTRPVQNRFEAIRDHSILTKIDIYKSAGQKDKAIALIDEVSKDATPGAKNRFSVIRNQLALVGSPAPALVVERGYGEFKGLDSLKGKVVVLDFFAHWCEPCKKEFPLMKQMLADLQPKGVEVVGVTTYYGFLGDPNAKLKPDEEYGKMDAFIKSEGLAWPIIFGKQDNFNAYGVMAIPEVVIIDRSGKIHSVHVGYSPEEFAKVRKAIQEALDAKS